VAAVYRFLAALRELGSDDRTDVLTLLAEEAARLAPTA